MNRKGFLCYISSLRFLDLPSEAHCLLTGRQKSYGTLISGNFPQTTIRAFMYGGFFCGLLSLILELAKGFVPVFLGQRFLDTHSLLFIPVLIAPVFGHAFPFFRKEKGGKAITASFGVLLGLLPEMRPAVYLAFFFIFFSLIVVVSPHSFRSVVTFGLFALCVLFTVKVPSIQIGSFLIAAVVIYRHFIKYLGEPLHIRLFKHTA